MQGHPRQAVQLAYMAGIMDGEGTIRIDKMKPSKKRKTKNPCYSVHISLGMVEAVMPQLFRETFGVGSRRVECVEGKRPVHRWHVRGNHCARIVIDALMPYLILKKRQADIALELIEGWKTPYSRKKGIDPLELRRREDLYRQMRKLNAVGAAAETERVGTREGETTVRTMSKGIEEDPKWFSRHLQVVSRSK